MIQQVPVPPTPPVSEVIVQGPGSLPPWVVLGPQMTALIAIAFFSASAVVLYPLMRAIGKRLEDRASSTDRALREEVEQLRARMADVEALQHRVMELEERVDFAERLLAQRREVDRLPGG